MPEGLKGEGQIRARLARLAQRFPTEVGRATFEEALIETGEAVRRTPVDKGPLHKSAKTHEPEIRGSSISVRITFGSVAVGYAVIQHEDLTLFHKVGQAKYLESVLNESRPFLGGRIGRRFELNRMIA